MKRVLMIALVATGVCGLLAVAQAQDEVTSVNAVGYVKIVATQGLTMVREDFITIDGADATPSVVIGDQLPLGSKIYTYSGGTYGVPEEYKEITSGFPPVVSGTNWVPNTATLDPGAGFWVSVPQAAAAASYDLVLMGEVPNNPTSTVPIAEGLNLVGYAFPADTKWVETDLAQKAALGDKIYIWDPAAQTYLPPQEYKEITAGFPPVVVGEDWPDTNLVITVGQGLWYKRGAGEGTLDWVETRPYDL